MSVERISESLRNSAKNRRQSCWEAGCLGRDGIVVLDDLSDLITGSYSSKNDQGITEEEMAILAIGRILHDVRGTTAIVEPRVKRAIATLVWLVQDGENRHRHVAMRAIGDFGSDAAEYIPLLRRLTEFAGVDSLLALRAYQTVARMDATVVDDEFWSSVAKAHPRTVLREWISEVGEE